MGCIRQQNIWGPATWPEVPGQTAKTSPAQKMPEKTKIGNMKKLVSLVCALAMFAGVVTVSAQCPACPAGEKKADKACCAEAKKDGKDCEKCKAAKDAKAPKAEGKDKK